MPLRRKIPSGIQQEVRLRARYLCEYCHTAESWQYVSFTIDHVIPLAQGGSDDLDNLALACFHCNRRKGDKTTVFDPTSNTEIPLFNPRQEKWETHFVWSANGMNIIGLTAIGRAAVEALELNRERALNIRKLDTSVGRHPPSGDPIRQEDQ